MMHRFKSRLSAWIAAASVAMAVCAMVVISAHAQTKEPIKIGFSMALTGPLGRTASRRCSA